jgi:hypothetical protein
MRPDARPAVDGVAPDIAIVMTPGSTSPAPTANSATLGATSAR